MNQNTKKMDVRQMTLTAILLALVVLLQFMGSFIRFGPFSISLVLIPIVIGAAECGIAAGAILGTAFGLTVLMSGDAAPFMAVSIPGTIATVMTKGILCGIAAALMYKLLIKFNKYLAVFGAAIICPIINTGIFLLGCRIFFWDTIAQWAGGGSAFAFLILGIAGGNFLFELGSNLILSPTVVRLLNIKNK